MPKRPASTTADKGSRAARTAFQGSLVATLILLINAFANPDLTIEQAGIIAGVALPIFSYLQNALEEAGAVPEMLKGAPAPQPDALDARKLEALAAATGEHQNALDRLERAIQDIRADLALRPHDAEPRVFTEQEAPDHFRG